MAGLDPVAVSTALTIGPVIFGPVGDDTRLESTVIGEPVNLAAKLDKHNKKLGTRALATQDAFAIALAQGYYPKALGRRDVLVGSMIPIRYVGPRSSDRFRRGPRRARRSRPPRRPATAGRPRTWRSCRRRGTCRSSHRTSG
jgi:hypothetical protein